MVVQVQQVKRDEQYPLLKVTSGSGDANHPQQPPSTAIPPGWNVACVPKRSWFDKWPEIISAGWMTLILLGITFLVFYALGMSAYRRQPIIFVKCNNSRPENNVFYHHIVPRGSYLPLSLYSEYLSSMSMEYPFLNLNVFFLIDDSLHTTNYVSKQSRLLKRFGPTFLGDDHTVAITDRDRHELNNFQRRYGNVNITVMPLSNYMALTPLRYKWKMIPILYLPFYARVFAVWEYGGIGLDLTTFNYQYNNRHTFDPRMTAILKQHNDGIERDKYIYTLNSINQVEQAEFLNMFYNLMYSIFNETYSFFDNPTFEAPVTIKTNPTVTISRNYRNKLENLITSAKNTSNNKSIAKIVNINLNLTEKLNNNMVDSDLYGMNKNATSDNRKRLNNSLITLLTNKSATNAPHNESKKNNDLEKNINITKTAEVPHVVLFYDFSVYSDGLGPSYFLPDVLQHPKTILKSSQYGDTPRKPNRPPYLLSISSDGAFVAVTSRHHPFLGHLFSFGCKRINPKFAIEDTLLTQCSGLLRNDVYCNNIYVLG